MAEEFEPMSRSVVQLIRVTYVSVRKERCPEKPSALNTSDVFCLYSLFWARKCPKVHIEAPFILYRSISYHSSLAIGTYCTLFEAHPLAICNVQRGNFWTFWKNLLLEGLIPLPCAVINVRTVDRFLFLLRHWSEPLYYILGLKPSAYLDVLTAPVYTGCGKRFASGFSQEQCRILTYILERGCVIYFFTRR